MNELEHHVQRIADQLYAAQIACIYKMPESWQQTPADFMGHTAFGTGVLIECKQVKGTSLTLSEKSNGIKPHQWAALERAHISGAHSLIVWQNGDVIVLIPFLGADQLVTSRKSIRWQDACERYKVTDLFLDLSSRLQQISIRPGSRSHQ